MAALAATTNAASGRGRWWVGLSPSCGDRNVNRLLKRHEKSVFVFLVVGGKSVLMNQDYFRVIRARFRELWKLLSNDRDKVGHSFHTLVTVHRPLRIADPGCACLL